MSSILFWHEQWTGALVNHLWQSTIVAALAWLIAYALKNNQARIRYWVWMVASAKFLVPFALFMTAGQWIRSMMAAPIAKPSFAIAIEEAALPFQVTRGLDDASVSASVNHLQWLPALLLAIWLCGVLVIAGRWMRAWMSIRAAVQKANPTEIAASVPVLCSASSLEPGVFGILHPVLLLPKGIMGRLQNEQLRAVLEHEMCHVRRRDNLTFALHMFTQALFWFHPLTWWIGSRLIEERERACDEAVLEAGGEAEAYAEGILSVCKFYVESPLACASGVSGSDLKIRITRIMSSTRTRQLSLSRKMLLGAAGFTAVLLPLMLGVVRSALAEERAEDAEVRLPKFEVASIKPHQPEQMMRIAMRMTPDGLNFAGLPLEKLVQLTFGLPENRIFNEPTWVKSGLFDIETKVSPEDAPKLKDLTMDERWAMMIPVLQERFGLKFHRETRNLEVYTLVVSKGGLKIKEAQSTADVKTSPASGQGRPMLQFSPNEMVMRTGRGGVTTEMLARMLSQQVGSTVLDKTGLSGKYEYELHWISDRGMGSAGAPAAPRQSDGEPPQESDGPSLFTALQEQLGLKLVSQKEPVEVVVIDHIQQPSAN
jgi:bla regulator protein blaR1